MRYTTAIMLVLIIVHGPRARVAGAAETLQPNVIIILADDLGYGDIGCYGSKVNRTPYLDRLAREGMRFTDFHSNGSMCSPTRVALLTGRYQQRTGIESALGENSKGLDRREVTIAEGLHQAGYASAIFGKWHLGPQPVDAPIHHGFDEFRGHLHGAVDYISHVDRYGRIDWFHNDQPANEEGYNTTLITEHAVRFIETHRNEPFFLYVSHSAIHFPWMTAEDEGYREPGKRYTDLRKLGPHEAVRPVVQEMIEALDRGVGRIVAVLEEHQLQRRTLVFFTSDNGGYLHYAGRHRGDISSNGPLRGQKGNMYEGGHRVPAIARWPGMIQPGTVTHETTATFDLFPTLLHVAGLGDKVAELNLDGQSIAPLLFENGAVAKRTLFWRMRGANAVRRGPWKLVVRGEGTPQLYNLDNDISEEHDLAAVRTDIVNQLETELSAWEADVDNDAVAVASKSQNTTHATNSLGMKLVQIEPGSFTMGSADGEWDERPVHQVTITRPFLMATTEVTNAQFEKFDPTHRKYRGTRGVSNEDDEAVVYVSWHDAVAFCKWLTEKEGKPYRLPTEAEWEYACRAGTTTVFHTGDTLPEVFHRNQPVEGDWATERFKKDGDLRAKKGKVPVSLRVGTMPANAFGLRQMHGNVEEWCHDWYGDYATSPEVVDPRAPADGLFKVSRGGSHNTYVRHLRSANRHGTLPEDKHWLIGFRVVQAPPLEPGKRIRAHNTLDDHTVRTVRAEWDNPIDRPLFLKPIPFVIRDDDHPHLADLSHHHCPSITWCDNGDLLAAWFNTRSELGREMVTLTSRLRHGANEWDKSRIFFAPADRNTTGVNLVNDGAGRLYFFNAIAESSHHRDQCLVMSTSETSGRAWTCPRIISNLDDRHKYTPMDAAFVAQDGELVVAMDYAPIGHSANECGSGVFISPDRGQYWLDRVSGKVSPEVGEGMTDGLIAGFHPGIVQLDDGRLMAFARTGNIDKRMTKSVSGNMGKTWTYQRSEFPPIGGGQRLVLMRLSEGPILLVSFTDSRRRAGMTFTDAGGREFTGYGMFAALSFDEGATWPVKKLLTAGGPQREVDGGGNTHEFIMDDTHAEPAGYLASTETPDGVIHLISSRWHYRFNLAWLKTPNQLPAQR